jgi:hypothetical protein
MAKSTKLKLSDIKKASNEIIKTRQHTIESGNYIDQTITFQPIFDDVAIEELLTEYGQLINEAEKKEIKLSQQMQLYLLEFLIIKYFTHFKSYIPSSLLGTDGKEGILDWLDHFRKTGLMKECLEVMFIRDQVQKVFNQMTDFAAKGLLAMNLNEEMMKKLQELQIQNDDIYKQLDSLKLENPIVE